MLSSYSILLPGDHTPRAAADGVVLAEPSVLDAGGSRRVWAHGALSLAADGVTAAARASLPRAVFIAVVTEAGQLAGITGVVGERALFRDPVVEVDSDERGTTLEIPFSIDIEQAFGPLLRDACHVHAAYGRYTSEVRRIDWPLTVSDPGAAGPPRTSMDALLRAHGLCRAGLFGPATEAFSLALRDARIAADLDGAHLHDAACAASRAAAASDGAVRDTLEEQGLRWLRQDLAQLEPLIEQARSAHREGRAARPILRRREALERRRTSALSLDPDLQHLRGLPGWAGVVRALG
ncbi:MAG: hypothetical protein ABI134_00315 [Byssovorax sp.]